MPTETGMVLLAYDGSDDAAAAIRRAGHLLAPRRAIVAHVWDSLATLLLHTDVRGLTGPMREAAEELDEEDRRTAERISAEGAELAREAGFDAEAHALQGKPKAWPTLLAKADAIDAAVVVIGSRGLGAVKSALLGSVSSGLLHHARRPVLVVPPAEEQPPPGPALIAYDGSDASRAGITAAAALLAVREAVIETVWISYSGVVAGGAIGMPVAVASRAAGELARFVAADATDTAHEGARLAATAGLEARAETRETTGPVWCALRDAAEAHGAPVIVTGSHGRGAMAATVLGSVSSALIHDAHLPVLVVPPTDG
jgi:nucleotide-binding universal stress UspA family protein